MSTTPPPDKKNFEMTAAWPLIKRTGKTYVRPQVGTLVSAMLLMLLASAMTGAMAKLMEPVIDNVFTATDKKMLWTVAISVFAVFAIRGFATYGHIVLMNKVVQRVVSNLQRDMFGHLIYSDLSFFHGNQSGQLMSRFIADTALIRSAVSEGLTGFGKNLFTVTFLVSVMVYQDWKLTLASLLVFPAAGFGVMKLSKKLRRISANMQARTGDLTSMLGQAFQGNRHVKSYGMEEFEKSRVNSIIENINVLMRRVYHVSSLITPIAEMLGGIALMTIIIYGGTQVMNGVSTAGKLFSFITAFMLAYDPMKRLARMNNLLQMGYAALDRTYKVIDTPAGITDKPGAIELKVKSSDVVFENVSFVYADGTEALHEVSFTAGAGKTVALVGESGAGKSTILNLIPRFFDINAGTIKVDGHDIRDLTLKSLRASLAHVSQEIAIFSDTIRDNISYGSIGTTDDQIIEAAKQAAAHDFILELPQGYDTRVGENGVKLSGGQRQRISIARAMLRNAPILLLDEATSALDTNSERLVQTALERLQKGRTTIVVAHRLSTIMNADVIYVMSQGRVVESGTHTELLSSGGTYARLYGNLLKETA